MLAAGPKGRAQWKKVGNRWRTQQGELMRKGPPLPRPPAALRAVLFGQQATFSAAPATAAVAIGTVQ
eukprot:855142-Prorocentrum_minimum.AAC.1